VRSFLLGLGAGAILETLHVTSKVHRAFSHRHRMRFRSFSHVPYLREVWMGKILLLDCEENSLQRLLLGLSDPLCLPTILPCTTVLCLSNH